MPATDGGLPDPALAAARCRRVRRAGLSLVFTNGCFDVLHPGHLSLLEQARALGDFLVVGLNTDRSVRALKGPGRPALPLEGRLALLSSLEPVDLVIPFDEDTPERLISEVAPDVLVKGGDYAASSVVGAASVEARGGRVVIVPLVEGFSTTRILGGGRTTG
ncbi:MAG: D-glycero-beta-D-manno-heptose 1-phosphate adenylyltransferase [Candidatus Fermentibacter sp.]|nr:D-glycero-beta-D-manno-heptose 1-phosphate adenylyltransferase [Candidatus Fermentibacter sp.]